MSNSYQTDCRFFSGYKPCQLNDLCSDSCPSKQVPEKKILIVHLEALGAVLRGTCILEPILRKWPQAHITWITSPRAAALLENNPYIDRIIKNDHKGGLTLSTLSFDLGFVIDKSADAFGIALKARSIKEIKGFGIETKTGAVVPLNPEAQELYDIGLSDHLKFYVNQKPETQLITEALGLDYQRDPYVFHFNKEEEKAAQIIREKMGLTGQKVIGLNTGCSPTIPYKKFSIDGWVKLIDKLQKEFPQAHLLLLGGPEDTDRNNEIFRRRPTRVNITPTQGGLREGLLYTSLCDQVITGDSLGMHMAIALGKFTVAWFGPTCSQEIDFFENGTAVKTQASCSPCWKRNCNKSPMCYDQVEFGQILRALKHQDQKKNKSSVIYQDQGPAPDKQT